jgi:Uncharacterized protein conserved in bacteria
MQFTNETPFESFFTVSYGKDGRERVVVVTKATYHLPGDLPPAQVANILELAAEQEPLIEADEFEGAAGLSAPLKESDFAHFKPRCDVLFCGNAYAYGSTAANVGLRIGQLSKSFLVFGPRHWQQNGLGGVKPSAPIAFARTRISYGAAYGGSDVVAGPPERIETYRPNPTGIGYFPLRSSVDGLPMPSTMRHDEPISSPKGRYAPVGFGPIGRNWSPRSALTGTYNHEWTDKRAPYFPDDFSYDYFQAAPSDQQIPYPRGGEEVLLVNLSAAARVSFVLPALDVPVLFVPHEGKLMRQRSNVDTILIEPEREVVTLTARAIYETRRSAFDVRETIVGGSVRSWVKERAAQVRKPYYSDLGAMVRARRR